QNQDEQSASSSQEADPKNPDEPSGMPTHGSSLGDASDGEPLPMTEEEAEKMLQSVRDRDLKRRYEKFQKMQRYYQPVDRDW
ncbi:MAG: hypothetical protein P8K78_06915, partial [Pirellulales bacterium]|nr:hypothetical protein [Pirellulales bacterium]